MDTAPEVADAFARGWEKAVTDMRTELARHDVPWLLDHLDDAGLSVPGVHTFATGGTFGGAMLASAAVERAQGGDAR